MLHESFPNVNDVSVESYAGNLKKDEKSWTSINNVDMDSPILFPQPVGESSGFNKFPHISVLFSKM